MFARAGWNWYKSQLTRRPLATKAITSAAIMSFSDILCQRYEITVRGDAVSGIRSAMPADVTSFAEQENCAKSPEHDWQRTFHVAMTGLVWTGPLGHSWYAVLEKVVGARRGLLGLAFRLILDAVVYSPVAVAGYFVLRSLLEGKGVLITQQKLEYMFSGAVLASWQFWPVANVFNFLFVPLPYRVLYNNTLSLLWNGYLSHLNSANQLL